MARWEEPNERDLQIFERWLADKPAAIVDVARAHPPWELFLLKRPGQVVVAHSFNEPEEGADRPVTMTVMVLGYAGEGWAIAPSRPFGVFGVKPEDVAPFEPQSAHELSIWIARASGEPQSGLQ